MKNKYLRLYEEYLATGNVSVRPELSEALRSVEESFATVQELHSYFKYETVIAWQCIRDQEFSVIDHEDDAYSLRAGDIIFRYPKRPIDCLLGISGLVQRPSGIWLRPKTEDYISRGDYEAVEKSSADQGGLYIPLYSKETIWDCLLQTL